MLSIRLKRIGKKHQPSYRVVVAERRSKLGGSPTEDIGSYNPFSKVFQVSAERVRHWLSRGARPTVTVHNLLVNHKVVEGPKAQIHLKRKDAAAGGAEAKMDTPAPTSQSG